MTPAFEHQEAQKAYEASLVAVYPFSPIPVAEPELHDRPVSKRIIDEWMRRV